MRANELVGAVCQFTQPAAPESYELSSIAYRAAGRRRHCFEIVVVHWLAEVANDLHL